MKIQENEEDNSIIFQCPTCGEEIAIDFDKPMCVCPLCIAMESHECMCTDCLIEKCKFKDTGSCRYQQRKEKSN